MSPGPRVGARLWWGVPLLLIVLWAAGSLLAAVYPGLPTPPLVSQVLLPIAGFGRFVAAMISIGALLVAVIVTGPRATRALSWAAGWAAVWLGCIVVLIPLTLSDVRAAGPSQVFDSGTLAAFLRDATVGRVLVFSAVAALVIAATATRVHRRGTLLALVVVALAAAAAPSFVGHSGSTSSHTLATISLGLHIAAISAWVGVLAVAVSLVRVEPERSSSLLPRVSLLALVSVLVAAETGLLNASLRVATPSAFVGTPYGSLILAKVVLLGVLIRYGWMQRSRMLPLLERDQSGARELLSRFAAPELLVMGSAVAISVALSRIGPSPTYPGWAVYTPLSLAVLTVVGPSAIAWATGPRPSGAWARAARDYPEIPAVLLLVLTVLIAGVGILPEAVGRDLAVVVGSIALLLVGWAWAVAGSGPRGLIGIVIVMGGWPVVLIVIDRMGTVSSGWRTLLVTTLLVEGVLVLMARRTRAVKAAPEPVHVAV